MKTTGLLACVFGALALVSNAAAVNEAPGLRARVLAGTLPPLTQRLPAEPRVLSLEANGKTVGRYGGDLRLLMGKARDIRMLVVYGYARLVGHDARFKLVPDILGRFEVKDNREFTFYLRPGHKWSDGHPFTTEDFRYYWEEDANNEDLSPFGPSQEMLVDGEPPTVEIIDATTVRYRWARPNPYFLTALAGARPLYIYAPAHYLRQFHARYADPGELADRVEEAGTRNWAGLHTRMGRQYKSTNPDLPTLDPWVNTTRPPSERFVFERNPYYHRVDEAGNQLPYIDRVLVNIVSQSLVPAKTGAGESDLQARYLRLDNYTFLKAGEERNNYSVRLWTTAKGSQLALYPNLNTNDPGWRELLRDARFRRALSLAVHRREINQVIYFGLVRESNNTVLPDSPLYKPEYQSTWAKYSPAEANRLLDEIGLTQRDSRGVRLMPDGRPVEIIVQTAGESTEETDVLELIHDSWQGIGVKLYTRPSQREVFRSRTFAGDTLMAVWTGLANAVPTEEMSPAELAPSTEQQLQWPKWGRFEQTQGKSGQPVDMQSAQELVRLNDNWRHATTDEARRKIWETMLDIHVDQVFTIGTVCGVPQPIVVNNDLRNVPEKGIYNWEPGSYFGVYQPDTFWFDR